MAHPYMANSVPALKRQMLDYIGVKDVEELFEQIPASHRLQRPLDLPPTLASESALRRHIGSLLARNVSCERNLNFLGAGCWQHHVPAVCDEIVHRTEWLHSVFGAPSSDHGRNQAWFEFASQLGELLGFDLVGLPVYSWGCAVGHALRMAARLTGRSEVLIPRLIDPERLSVIRSYCEPSQTSSHLTIVAVDADREIGLIDLNDFRAKLSARTAAVYLETPAYLGTIETRAAEIAQLARAAGAETILGVDPLSLGVLAPPAELGADFAVGPTQPLGVHMNCGGGTGGFIATRDDERYARQYPTLMISIAETTRAGEYGFGLSLFHQTSYGLREKGNDWTGNSVYMWAIANATYMALLGPAGFRELGEAIMARSDYAARRVAALPGVRLRQSAPFFKEFVVDFSATGKSVREINAALLARGIFGGKDLSAELPGCGQSALYCVTEIHAREDLDRLADALQEVLAR
jgi:glycine dehydrogenase subunit 1